MAAVASIKFTQASGATDVAGRAVKGIFEGIPANDKVTITNGDNTDVASWKIELLYNPPGSALGAVPGTPVVLDQDVSATPSADLDPDVGRGSYRVRLTVYDSVGNSDIDIRNFSIPDGRGFVIPPYQKLPDPIDLTLKNDELNFSGQEYGWLGDEGAGMHYDHWVTMDDLPYKLVSSTPFTASPVGEEPFYLVNMTSIGSDAVFNIPSTGWRDHQRIWVQAYGDNSYELTINPATNPINGLSTLKLKSPNVAQLVRIAGTGWTLIGAKYDYYERSLVAGVENVQVTGFQSVGSSILIDTRDFPNGTFDWRVVIETTDALDAAEIRLFNVTDGAAVAGTTLSTTDLTPDYLEASGITLQTAYPCLYSAQLRLQTTGSPNVATCRQAQIVANWLQP